VNRTRQALLAVSVGLALLVGAPVVWSLSQPAPTVGEVVPAAVAPAVPTLRAVPAPDHAPAMRVQATATGAQPQHLVIADIGVDHPVVPVGLEPDGSMEIPENVHEIGWYTRTRVRPGDPGSAVLAGHVDSRVQGRGAFFDLGQLDLGAEVAVGTDAGTQRWQVTGRTSYDKTVLPIDDLFTVDGPPRLVLITCGGPFDSDTRHYTENVVVLAELVDTGVRAD
jgi:hypothetical protein